MPKALLLCTGNYYRSRFAEELSNHLARHHAVDWIAESRALAIERLNGKSGAVSTMVLEALHVSAAERAGIELQQGMRLGFDEETDRKTGKPRAANLRLL
jgi:protein-tyrosine-phosphatase